MILSSCNVIRCLTFLEFYSLLFWVHFLISSESQSLLSEYSECSDMYHSTCILYFMYESESFSYSFMSNSLWPHGLYIACQAPLSRQECWSGLSFPSLGHRPDPGTEPRSPALQADLLLSEPRESHFMHESEKWKWSLSIRYDSLRPHGLYHTSLSMGFSRQGCWSGLSFPSPEDLPDPGIEPRSPTL